MDTTTSPCDGCGRCCQTIGTPPGYAMGFSDEPPEWFAGSDDGQRLQAMPWEVWRELASYYAAVDEGLTADRSAYDIECLWYDAETKGCRHYEWRPAVCREFEPGSRSCNTFRLEVGLGRIPKKGLI